MSPQCSGARVTGRALVWVAVACGRNGVHAVAEQLIRRALSERNACISFQVVQAWLNTVLRKAEVPLDLAGARSYLDVVLAPLMQVPASLALYQRARDVRQRWQFSFYDSLIVAAALLAGCRLPAPVERRPAARPAA